MDYFGIIKRAYEIALKKNRYLWIFGLLAGGAGLGNGFNLSLPSDNNYSDKLDKVFTGSSGLKLEHLWLQYWGVLVAIAGLILLLAFVWLVLSLISQGALLGSVERIEKGEKNNFRLGLIYGWHKFWRVFAVGLFLGLLIILSVIVLVVPIVLLVLAKIYVLAVLFGLTVFLVDLIFWLYIGLMQPYILRTAVLGNRGAWRAISSSGDFFKAYWKEILVMYLLVLAVGIAAGVAILLSILLVGGLLSAIGFALYLASQFVFWIYVALFGLAFVIFVALLGGIFNTFNSSVFTLTYLELVTNRAKKS